MKLHLFHLAPHGLVRAYSHVVAGRRLCRATGNPTKGLFPRSVNSMTAAWNFYQTVKAQPLEPPRTILDIGANTSQMSRLLAMACPSAPKLYSFEPNEALQPMGSVFRIALSDADGEASFYLPSNDDDWGTIEAGKANADSARKVQCRRFDTLLKDGTLRAEDLPRPVLAKIDTEGSEMRVINGFGDSLKLVDYLLVEVENTEERGRNYNLLSLSAQLRAAGFNHAKILYACYDGPSAPAYSDILFWR